MYLSERDLLCVNVSSYGLDLRVGMGGCEWLRMSLTFFLGLV